MQQRFIAYSCPVAGLLYQLSRLVSKSVNRCTKNEHPCRIQFPAYR